MESEPATAGVTRRDVTAAETVRVNRRWWDGAAAWYQNEHGRFLGDARFVWCPEGLDEAQVRLLGDVRGRRVLEVGCGAAQCSRWLTRAGAVPVGVDLSLAQLRHGRALDAATGTSVVTVLADAQALPFGAGSFDLACSAFGGVPFVADSAAVMREVSRVLRPGGRWVFSVSHPMRWCFPDDPGPGGLTVRHSYFDRRPYVEQDEQPTVTYAEHHRTLGDRVHEVVAGGFTLRDVVEPQWPPELQREWGGWSPLRGALMPGTAIFVCERA